MTLDVAIRTPTQRAAWAPDAREDRERYEPALQSTVVQTLPLDFQQEAPKPILRPVDRIKSSRLPRASTYRLPGKTTGVDDAEEDEKADKNQEAHLDKRSTLHKAATSAALSSASGPSDPQTLVPIERRRKTAPAPREIVNQTKTEEQQEKAPAIDSLAPAHRPRRHRSSVFDEMVDSEDVVTLCLQLGLSKKNVWQLRRAFNSEDPDGTNTITLASFFFLIREEKRALTKSLLQLAHAPSSSSSASSFPRLRDTATRLSFDEFVRVVVSFASFSEQQVLAFFFDVYAAAAAKTNNLNTKTTMTDSELESLATDLQVLQTAFARNVQVATAKSTAQMTFADFERLARQHSVAFLFPLLQIQRHVRQTAGLGEAFWKAKARERAALERLLAFMELHHGALPPLSVREWLSEALSWGWRETATSQRRALARRIYAARQSQS